MSQVNNPLHDLAARARQGDLAALAQLRKELEPSMVHIVRRALRTECKTSPLTRHIRQTAQAVTSAAPPASDGGGLVDRVARRLCASLFGRLRARGAIDHRQMETVRG